MPGPSLPASALAFHGICQSPIFASGTSDPSGWGSDHRQQKPAESRAVCPSFALDRTSASTVRSRLRHHHARVEFRASRRLKDEFDNGEEYFAMQSSQLWLPTRPEDRPRKEYLEWHNDLIFLR
jgi:hypothetical protein